MFVHLTAEGYTDFQCPGGSSIFEVPAGEGGETWKRVFSSLLPPPAEFIDRSGITVGSSQWDRSVVTVVGSQ